VMGDMSAVTLHRAKNMAGHMPSGRLSTNVLGN